MTDGRKRIHARAAAGIVAVLATVSLGLTISPAAAAPHTNDLDSAQARAHRLSQRADTADRRQRSVSRSLTHARTSFRHLTSGLRRQQRLMDNLRTQVASTVVEEYDPTGGASVPTRPLANRLDRDSKVMLTNVTVVSEDTGGRGDAMARSNKRIQLFTQRRTAVRDEITILSGLEKSLRGQQKKADAEADHAAAVVSDLEAKAEARRVAAMGGPAVAYAKAQVGKAYVYGAAGPNAFDCSGLTMAAWSQAGVSLPHSSSAQYSSGRHISESELQPGDLVFYYSPISHVGMYVGNGQIVNALNPGAGVRISGLHDMPYVGAVRPGG